MTDRIIVYPGSIPLETDLLNAQRFQMIGLGFLAQATIGYGTMVDGLSCGPTSPASLSVVVSAGSIFQLSEIDASAYGDLSAATEPLVKIGINVDTTQIAFTPPSTSGQSQCFLIEAQLLEADGIPVTLNYFNSSNILQPFSGPANAGTPNNTERTQRVSLQVVAGNAATTGSQVAPSAQTGWVPLYVITLANGATSIVSGNIATAIGAPFITNKIAQIRAKPGIAAFTTPGTYNWTVPAGVNSIKPQARGSGAGGGGANATGLGGGGGGGGWGEGWFDVQSGQVIQIVVQAGANGGAGTNSSGSASAGSNGLATTVTNTTTSTVLITANGGVAGGAGNAGNGSGGTGGSVTGATRSRAGDQGGIGYQTGTSEFVGGTGGASQWYSGHAEASATLANGLSGWAPGVGGAGGIIGGNGGSGAAGEAYIEY